MQGEGEGQALRTAVKPPVSFKPSNPRWPVSAGDLPPTSVEESAAAEQQHYEDDDEQSGCVHVLLPYCGSPVLRQPAVCLRTRTSVCAIENTTIEATWRARASASLQRRGALPLDLGLRLAGEIAQALRAAHAAGIVHRDRID